MAKRLLEQEGRAVAPILQLRARGPGTGKEGCRVVWGRCGEQGRSVCPRLLTFPFSLEPWAALIIRICTNRKIFLPSNAAILTLLALPGGTNTAQPTQEEDYTPYYGLRPLESWFCRPLWLLPPSLTPQVTQFSGAHLLPEQFTHTLPTNPVLGPGLGPGLALSK